jgi:hypothetical protein
VKAAKGLQWWQGWRASNGNGNKEGSGDGDKGGGQDEGYGKGSKSNGNGNIESNYKEEGDGKWQQQQDGGNRDNNNNHNDKCNDYNNDNDNADNDDKDNDKNNNNSGAAAAAGGAWLRQGRATKLAVMGGWLFIFLSKMGAVYCWRGAREAGVLPVAAPRWNRNLVEKLVWRKKIWQRWLTNTTRFWWKKLKRWKSFPFNNLALLSGAPTFTKKGKKNWKSNYGRHPFP